MAGTDSKTMHGSTNSQTFFNMVRCLLGMGTLTLPKAVARSGIIPLGIASAIIPFLSFKAATWAVALKEKHVGSGAETDHLCKVESATESGSANGTARAEDEAAEARMAFRSCLGGFDLVVRDTLGVLGQTFFLVAVLGAPFSGGVTYINAIEEGLQLLFPGISQNVGLLCIGLVLMTLTLLAPNLRDIAFLSLASTLVLLYIFVSVPIAGIHNSALNATDRLPLWHASAGILDYGYTAGSVAFGFCAFALAMCLYEDMNHKEDFEWVMGTAFATSALTGASFGVVGYWAFGTDVKELVYLNFPLGSATSIICIVAYSLILIASYLLLLTPVFLFAKVSRYHIGQRCLACLCIATGALVAITGCLSAILTAS